MRRQLRFLTAVSALACIAIPAQAETVQPGGIAFDNLAAVDTTEVVFVSGERWCPKVGSWSDDQDDASWGKCLVELVEGPPSATWRPDWDHAMMACRSAGFPLDECEESVGDGEF